MNLLTDSAVTSHGSADSVSRPKILRDKLPARVCRYAGIRVRSKSGPKGKEREREKERKRERERERERERGREREREREASPEPWTEACREGSCTYMF